MTTDFTSLNLHAELMHSITELGYSEPTPIQASMIPLMLTSRRGQSARRKQAQARPPPLHSPSSTLSTPRTPCACLILAPTRELALQVSDPMTGSGRHLDVRVLAVYGGQPYGPQIKQTKSRCGYCRRRTRTACWTSSNRNNTALNLIKHVRIVVLDEADEMLNMGFIEDVEKILGETPPERHRPLYFPPPCLRVSVPPCLESLHARPSICHH